MDKIRTVEAYKLPDGKCPFKEWRKSIPDIKTRFIVDDRIDRAALGNIGDCKAIRDGVYELRIHAGPGYRVYFAYEGKKILLLLIGGDKSTQNADIKTAKDYWKEYQERNGG